MIRLLVVVLSLQLLNGCGSGGGSDFAGAGSKFQVSGRVVLEANAEQDADILGRGLAHSAAQNDQFDTAQQINNPTALGGYLSYNNGAYSNGEAYFQDRVDVYALPALSGQTIEVKALHADLDPFLPLNVRIEIYSASDTSVPIYIDVLDKEGIFAYEVPSDDDYFIRLAANSLRSGPTIYQLEVSAELTSGLKLSSGYQALASDSIVMQMTSGALFRTQASVAGTEGSDALAKLQSVRSAAYLDPFKDIVVAEPDYLVKAVDLGVNDPLAPLQWNLEIIGLPDAWNAATGAGVRVAVLDTGVDGTHGDLQNNLAMRDGYDFVSSLNNGDGDGIDSDPTELSDDAYFHGTYVAGVIAADTNDGRGIAGIARDATLVPVRVLAQDGAGSSFDIAEGIRYAAGLQTYSGPTISEPVDIINLSLGLEVDSSVIAEAIRDAVAAGVIVIASAGNDESDNPFYPAAYPEVIGVGAFNHARFRSSFSNFGVNIDLLAPGGTDGASIFHDDVDDGIVWPVSSSGYVSLIGTSFAAPHVAAVAALMKQVKPSLTPAFFRNLLVQGRLTDQVGSREFYGYGLLNAAKAVASVGGVLADQLVTFPDSLSFSSADSKVVIELSNPGVGDVEVIGLPYFDEAWLSVGATDLDADGLGRYAIEIDRSMINTDIASATLSIDYHINGGGIETKTVPVLQYVQRTGSLDGVYVYLVPVNSAESASASVEVYQSQLVESDTGQYVFDFPDVLSGNYYLETSTDNDGDGQLFDPGEAIGAYRLSNGVDSLHVTKEKLDLIMTLSYDNYFEQHEFDTSPVRTLPEIVPVSN